MLTGDDRIIMTMYLENSNSFRQIAKLTGVNECTVARRIHKITKRLMDGYFILCLRNRDRLSSFELKIAKEFFVNALPMTKIAEKKNISYHSVRKAMRKIKKCINAKSEALNSKSETNSKYECSDVKNVLVI